MRKYIIFTFAFAIMSLIALATGVYLLTINHIALGLIALIGASIYTYVTYNHIKESITIYNT